MEEIAGGDADGKGLENAWEPRPEVGELSHESHGNTKQTAAYRFLSQYSSFNGRGIFCCAVFATAFVDDDCTAPPEYLDPEGCARVQQAHGPGWRVGPEAPRAR